MATLRAFFRHHVLWGGLGAVLIPLLIILGMQYWSLVSLEKTSAVAVMVTLRNYLNAVATEVKYFYQTNAEHALNISPQAFTADTLDKVAQHFQQKTVEGAKRLFVVTFPKNAEPQVLFYDPVRSALASQPGWPETRAVRVACAPWHLLSQEGTVLESGALEVNLQDPENRIILNPILDESWRVIGVAGMIIDLAFFQESFLPRVIQKSLAKHLPAGEQENVIVSVYNGSGELVLATQPVQGQDNEVRSMLWFVFPDWYLGIRTRYETPEQWAHRQFWINVSLSILMTAVLIGGIVLALRTAARAMKLSQMKTDFVSNVSHELRTPLASVRVFGEFLRLGRVKEPEKVREYGDYIETESRRLTQLINNILDFSKIESGQKTYRFESTDVEEVVAETMKLFDVRLRHRGGTLMWDAPQEPLPPAFIDPDALVQALMNLLDNAVKYSGSAQKIWVRLGRTDGYLTISVTDAGIGILPDQQEKIFEKFYRVSTGLVHEVKGSGLGLSIVKHIVEAHRGKVVVKSSPGHGSTFTIFLPVEEQAKKHFKPPHVTGSGTGESALGSTAKV